MVNFEDITKKVCLVAKEAAKFIATERLTFSEDKIETKSMASDLVSYVDKEAEKIIIKGLQPLIEGAKFITEEETIIESQDENSRYCWVIDPLDGTTNFAHGLSPYCVSIALMEEKEVVVGVVHIVTTSESFYSWKGAKSFLNGSEIKVSTVASLSKSLIASGFYYNNSKEQQEQFMRYSLYLMMNTHGFRRTGSAAANLVFVACGRVDGFAQVNLAPWDVAAGALIAKNSGANISDYSGGENYIFGKEIIVSNSLIFDEYKELINSKEL